MFYAKNPVQSSQTTVENVKIVPVVSPAPSSVVDVSKDDINEFKMRLHVAEKKLEEDKVLLNAILEKVRISFPMILKDWCKIQHDVTFSGRKIERFVARYFTKRSAKNSLFPGRNAYAPRYATSSESCGEGNRSRSKRTDQPSRRANPKFAGQTNFCGSTNNAAAVES